MPIALTAKVTFATALGGFGASILAVLVAVGLSDVTSGVVVRTVLIATLLLVAPYRLVLAKATSTPTATRGRLIAGGLVGVVLGFCINPSGWDGHSFFAQLVLDPGPTATALDLVGWVLLGALSTLAAVRAAGATATDR